MPNGALLRRMGAGERRLAATERRLVWMFGSPRSGSTWLLNMLATRHGIATIDEPGIGSHLGLFAPDLFVAPARTFAADRLRLNDARADDVDYFFARRFADAWEPQLRRLILSRFAAQLAVVRPSPTWCVIKEPNGSQAADLLLSVLPKSRLLFLLRDGRDVVDSQLDAFGKESWLGEWGGGRDLTGADRLAFIEEWSLRWVFRSERVLDAYDQRPGDLRLKLRYETLRVDPAGELRNVLDWLGVDAGSDLDAVVGTMQFEALPEDKKGSGRFARKATPGHWRESFSAAEQELANRIMSPTLRRMGYDAD